MELVVDHIMFPVYNNLGFLDEVEQCWKKHHTGVVMMGPPGPQYKGVYYSSKSFYVEHLSTVKGEPYWSNTIYFVVDKKHWEFYENPDMVDENWLKPRIRGGFALLSPDHPGLQSKHFSGITYDGFTILISKTLEEELREICGLTWKLPANMAIDEKLLHSFDMAVVNENDTLVAPLYQHNFALFPSKWLAE